MTFDGKAFGAEIVAAVKTHVQDVMTPIMSRLDEIEQRLKDAVSEDLPARLERHVASVDRVSAQAQQLEKELAEVRAAIAELPAPVDGKDGQSVTDIDVSVTDEGKSMVISFTVGDVEHSFEIGLPEGPAGKDGEPGKDGKDGVPGKDGRDGLDVKDLFRADGGKLVAVMSDGSTKDLGVFVGKDGEPGKDGRDGLGFDDMKHEIRDEGVYLVWERGEETKDAFLPVPFYRGVWAKDNGYRAGNTVTWGGSSWIATKDSPEGKPDAPGSDWVLSNKRGRDGKDAK